MYSYFEIEFAFFIPKLKNPVFPTSFPLLWEGKQNSSSNIILIFYYYMKEYQTLYVWKDFKWQ